MDFPVARLVLAGADDHPRPDRAGAVVNLRLRQIEQIFPLDVARTHVIADGVADDLAARVDDQRQLRLRHVPARVFANAHRITRSDDFLRQRLKEQFGPLCVVNTIVGRRAEVRLLHARLLAAQISHACRPDLLRIHRSKQLYLGNSERGQIGARHGDHLRGHLFHVPNSLRVQRARQTGKPSGAQIEHKFTAHEAEPGAPSERVKAA